MKLIIADKDPHDLQALAAELASPDVDISLADDGREVLQLVAKGRPDVVIAAASLGQMGAFAVSRELKMQADVLRALPSPKVLILLEREADAWLAAWSRCDAWLLKPVSADDVRDVLAQLVDSSSARATTRLS